MTHVISPRLLFGISALLAGLALSGPIVAQSPSQAIIKAFEDWQSQNGITRASIAVIPADAPMITQGYGQAADAPITLASLSKAITGACVAILQQEGVFDLDSPVSDLIDMPEGSGRLPDFLSQTSGLLDDITQGQPWHLEADRIPRHMLATELALNTPRGDATFRYNNANFAVLGAVIDAVAQVDYETDCRDLLLAPLGITTAALDPVWGPLGAWGGWSMSVGDYARFISEWFGSPRNIGQDPLSWPHAKLGRGRAYVMGSFHRRRRGIDLFWHAGQLCWNGEGSSSYFASYGGDPVVVVGVPACLSRDAFATLEGALFQAALN